MYVYLKNENENTKAHIFFKIYSAVNFIFLKNLKKNQSNQNNP